MSAGGYDFRGAAGGAGPLPGRGSELPQRGGSLQLPQGRHLRLPGRGTTFVRESEGPPGAPTLVLLHGWVASGGLNWFRNFETLSRDFRVIAPDLRGHARGIRSRRPFRLSDCADDVAALLEELDAGPAIVAGYSMGGAVAQLTWKRHRPLVSGLVLCATAPALVPKLEQRIIFGTAMSMLAGGARLGELSTLLPRSLLRSLVREAQLPWPQTEHGWAAGEFARHDWRMLIEAGVELSRFDARSWIQHVDVPTAVVVTRGDRAMRTERQLSMARRIPKATTHPVDGGHLACARAAFAKELMAACGDVAARIAA